MRRKSASIMLCGYVRGVLSNIPGRNWEEETTAHYLLRSLGCPDRYLPDTGIDAPSQSKLKRWAFPILIIMVIVNGSLLGIHRYDAPNSPFFYVDLLCLMTNVGLIGWWINR